MIILNFPLTLLPLATRKEFMFIADLNKMAKSSPTLSALVKPPRTFVMKCTFSVHLQLAC